MWLEVWTFDFTSCYFPAVSYLYLAGLSLTKQDLNCIQRKAMSIVVPWCGYNCNIKTATYSMRGPLLALLACDNFCSMYVQARTRHLPSHYVYSTLAHQAVNSGEITMHCSRVVSGSGYSFLFHVTNNVHHLLPYYLKSKRLLSIRSFLTSINSNLWLNTNDCLLFVSWMQFHHRETSLPRRFSGLTIAGCI